jgi:hypothetical protein
MDFKYVVPGDVLMDDILNNTVPETLWQKIYLYLTKLGYEVYAPGQKRDKCQNSYIVVKENGSSSMDEGGINGYRPFDIIVYHPLDQYSSMQLYFENVKQSLENITELRYTGNETPSIVDDEVQAYTTSATYQQYKRLRR